MADNVKAQNIMFRTVGAQVDREREADIYKVNRSAHFADKLFQNAPNQESLPRRNHQTAMYYHQASSLRNKASASTQQAVSQKHQLESQPALSVFKPKHTALAAEAVMDNYTYNLHIKD